MRYFMPFSTPILLLFCPPIKSIHQGDHVDPAKRLYSGVVDCAKKTMGEGWKAFYKGFTPSITRAMPVNGAIFTGFTAAQRALA